jgi:hypothetical protein
MPDIEDLYASVPGLKADYKVDWKEDAKVDWKIDWDAIPGGAEGVAPVNTVAPSLSGVPQVGQTLTVTNGTWTGNPAPTFTYEWFAGVTPIAGAVAATYVLTGAELGDAISVDVTATNAAGEATESSNITPAVIAA